METERPCGKGLLKTLWENEKVLASSIFSLSTMFSILSKDRNLQVSKVYFFVCKCFQFGLVKVKDKENKHLFNPVPYIPILGLSNSAANKDMMSKIWTNGDTII